MNENSAQTIRLENLDRLARRRRLDRHGSVIRADAATDDQPETVLVTFHVQSGHEEEMKKVLADAWQAYTRLDMVLPQPHVILQGSENGRPYFVEILTWKDRNIPDHMPAEVQTIWKHMGAICEKRGDKPPIDGGEVRLIVPSA